MPADLDYGAHPTQSPSAAILAGGFGTRLRAVVGDRPKVLAEVGGRPFLSRLLDQLARAGVQQVVLCTGYLGEQVEQTYGSRYGEMDVYHSRESTPLGTGGALRAILPLVGSDPVLILNGDSYCDFDIADFARFHRSRASEASIVLARVADTSRYGRVNVGPDGRIESFEEKAAATGPGWINAGAYLVSRRALEQLPEHEPLSLEREVFPAWIDGAGMSGYRSEGRFLDIGTPASYAAAEHFFSATT
jgi:D-glycero-alpha-D-manno-heptose 1-phosphate guanylyltransferase